MRIQVAFVSLLLASLPPSASGQQTVADPLVGCYTLELGSWDPPLQPGNARYQIPPDTFQLTDEVGVGPFESGSLLVRPRIPYGRTPRAYWEAVGPDSVRVIWTNGFAGVYLHLQRKEDALEGRAEAFTDVVGGAPPPETDVVVWRIECKGSAPA